MNKETISSRQNAWLVHIWPEIAKNKLFFPCTQVNYIKVFCKIITCEWDQIHFIDEKNQTYLWSGLNVNTNSVNSEYDLYIYSEKMKKCRVDSVSVFLPSPLALIVIQLDNDSNNLWLQNVGLSDLVWDDKVQQMWSYNRLDKSLRVFDKQMEVIPEIYRTKDKYHLDTLICTSTGPCWLANSTIHHPSKNAKLKLEEIFSHTIKHQILYDVTFDRYLVFYGAGNILRVINSTGEVIHHFGLSFFNGIKRYFSYKGYLLIMDSRELWVLSVIPTQILSVYFWPMTINKFYFQGEDIYIILDDSSCQRVVISL